MERTPRTTEPTAAGLQAAEPALYPDARMLRRLRHLGLFKTALLVLLALGIAVQPVLGAVSELHGAEHAAMADVAPDHGHAHADDVDHGHESDKTDPNHVKGTHVLMHLDAGLAVALPDAIVRVPARIPDTMGLPEGVQDDLPVSAPHLPFRPPIA